MADRDAETSERRFTRPKDPSLTDEANRLLDRELEEATGARVEEGPPRAEDPDAPAPAGRRSSFVSTLVDARPILGLTLLVLVIVGCVVGLTTGSWIVLVVLVGLHAIATAVVATGVIQMTTETEHVAPEVSARLSAEGVADPDRLLTDLVQEVAGDARRRGPAEVVTPGHDERTQAADGDQATSTAEQRTALTPTSRGTPVTRTTGAVAALPWWVVIGVMALSIAFGAIDGGLMWVATAIVLVAGSAWIGMDRFADRRLGTAEAEADSRTVNRVAVAAIAAVVLAIMAFVTLMGVIVSN